MAYNKELGVVINHGDIHRHVFGPEDVQRAAIEEELNSSLNNGTSHVDIHGFDEITKPNKFSLIPDEYKIRVIEETQ